MTTALSTRAPATGTEVARSSRSTQRSAWLMLGPAIGLLVAFVYLPAVLSFVASLFDVPLASGAWDFVGFDNYADNFADDKMWQALRNTVVYSAGTIIPSLVIGFGLALLCSGIGRRYTVLSTLLFLPFTANLVAMAVVFRWIFAFRGGLANELVGIVGIGPVNFLGETGTSLFTVALVGIWRSATFCMILFLAGLTAIPSSVHEAAAMDGVKGLVKVRKVIVPVLRPAIVLASVMAILQSIQAFDTINVMTGGGPLGSSETLLTYTWKVGFEEFDLGRSSALSFLLLVVLLAIGWARKKSVMKTEA